ncbi:hypothetical protein VB712_11815 [Spirulina sp. CCNP1310]|nr:hypothetical protein [Spirulina sp. CCNP1310]
MAGGSAPALEQGASAIAPLGWLESTALGLGWAGQVGIVSPGCVCLNSAKPEIPAP